MSNDLPTQGSQMLTNAERQPRYRARKAEQAGTTIRYRRPADRPPGFSVGMTRWQNCSPLQAGYAPGWTPCRMACDTATAEALQAIVDL